MAVTARSHGTAYGHRTLTEWERAMTTLTTTNNNRELTEALTEVDVLQFTTSTTTGGLGASVRA
jgi:hypothetical protein